MCVRSVLPRTFRFNVTRTIINANLAAQRDIAYKRDKLLQQALPLHTNNIANANNNANSNINNNNNNNNLDSHRPSANPSAARIVVNPIMDAQKAVSSASVSSPVTTIMPQFYSTIDYVNVNHMPPLQSPWSPQQQSPLPTRVGTLPNQAGVVNDPQHYHAVQGNSQAMTSNPNSAYNRIYGNHKMWQLASSQPPANVPKISDKQASVGARLTCDIDDVFPVPEVSIYRLAKLDGSYPEKLAKFETKIDKDNVTGSYHVQVTSIIDDQDLIRKYGQQQTSYFQCLIALPNLESTRYDSKRTIVYTPDIDSNMIGRSEDLTSSPDVTSSSGQLSCHVVLPLLMPVIFALTLTRPNHGDLLI
ncbi:hypothetical protein GZH46_01727 [Fragariocoptes setiger]|uniref:Uncharacterized protein n=1 Tax=Fragariocoptes setiger TaxID=1670756 RepID=A0ABQ7S8P3_9ACAR|nr:hypothetical protein GZH46_01727 [Fragariocoptes setiger]